MLCLQSVKPWILVATAVACGCSTGAPPAAPAAPGPAATTISTAAPDTPEPGPAASGTPAETAQANPLDSTKPEAAAVTVKELSWDQLQELLAGYRGKIVVVDLWSTSCEPCLREFPHLVALQKRHPEDVVCVSFDCDYDGRKNRPVAYYRERVVAALQRMQATDIVNVMSTVAADELFQQIDLDSIPAVCIYDRAGKLVKRFDNRTPASETEEGISYETQIDPLVAELVKAEQN